MNDFLSDKAQAALSTQSYDKSPKIEGVELKDLHRFVDDGGSFMELGRYDGGMLAGFPNFEVKQINYSQVLSGVIKAFHLHANQEDIWFVPPCDRVLVVLHDARKGSATEGTTMRFVMGDGKSQLLYIPRGVAHGYTNASDARAQLVYFVNQQFDPESPDEKRLPWDFVGKEVWDIIKG